MEPNRHDTRVLLRLGGEIFIKSRRTRTAFLRRLRENLRDALAATGTDARLEQGWDRLYLHGPLDAVLPVAIRVFGISSLSPVEVEVPATLDAIVEAGGAAFTERVRGRRFAVRARRAGEHRFSSQDVMVRLGARLLDASAGVDLDDPEVEVHVEVREDRAYLFSERVPGAGGLPLGVEGRAVT